MKKIHSVFIKIHLQY